ncbi:MAG: hypothetical protein KGQ36_06960 [Rickettsiales bacterium]|nr:hypothetical protein [Rickettsiales bacterium]
MKKRNLGAFSLIEMAIVILVVGIIIAGVTQSSSIIARAKVNSARALTQSSPVASTPGLRLWLETLLDESFISTEIVDGGSISTWNDINTQVSNKLYARAGTSNILYKQVSTINSLPSLYFPSGAALDFFTIATNATGTVVPTAIPTPNNAFSYFIVARSEAASSARNIFYNGTIASSGWGYGLTTTAKTALFDTAGSISVTAGSATTTAEVISATYSGGTVGTGTLKMYTNGVLETLSVTNGGSASVVTPATGLYIGSSTSSGSTSTNWKGYISEVILFEKKLSDNDRRSIEQYLGKKYNITVTTS